MLFLCYSYASYVLFTGTKKNKKKLTFQCYFYVYKQSPYVYFLISKVCSKHSLHSATMMSNVLYIFWNRRHDNQSGDFARGMPLYLFFLLYTHRTGTGSEHGVVGRKRTGKRESKQ